MRDESAVVGASVRIVTGAFKGKRGQILRAPTGEDGAFIVDVLGQRDRLYLYRIEFDVLPSSASPDPSEPS